MAKNEILKDYSILIVDGRIEEIDKKVVRTDDIYEIDGRGKYLIPGLSDMHSHINYKHDNNLLIANGVTLVRNMHGEARHLEMREKIANGEILGPELWTGTPLIDGAEPMWPFSVNIIDKAEVEKIITDLHQKGYDFVKTYNTLSEEVYLEIMRVANELNMRVAGHISYYFDEEKAIKAGHYSDEHMTAYDLAYKSVDDARPMLELAIEKDMWNVPTMITIRNNERYDYFMKNGYENLKYCVSGLKNSWSKDWYLPYWDYKKSIELIKELNYKGGKLVTGTDHGAEYVIPGFSVHEELEIFVDECGLSPYDALITSTINPAVLLEIDDRIGTIEVGKDADLVLLNKNPLENIRNTRSIESVFVKGILLDRDQLDSLLKKVEIDYK